MHFSVKSQSGGPPPRWTKNFNAFLHNLEPIQKKVIWWWNGHDPPSRWKFPSCFFFEPFPKSKATKYKAITSSSWFYFIRAIFNLRPILCFLFGVCFSDFFQKLFVQSFGLIWLRRNEREPPKYFSVSIQVNLIK